MKKIYGCSVYLCMHVGFIMASQAPMDISPMLFARANFGHQVLFRADRAIGTSFSLATRGVSRCFKFCRDYPRLVLFVFVITPLMSSRVRTSVFDSASSVISFVASRIWSCIDSRLFGWMHQNMADVQSSLGAHHEELVGQGTRIGLLKTEITTVGNELQDQIKKLEGMLEFHAQELGAIKGQEQEISGKIDSTHSLVRDLDGKIVLNSQDLRANNESLKALREALSELEEQVGTQHRDLFLAMEQRFASLPDSQRLILDEYGSAITSRFDKLSCDMEIILQLCAMHNNLLIPATIRPFSCMQNLVVKT